MEKKRFEFASLSKMILIETIDFFSKTFSFLSSLSTDPLFSIVVALYSLILLYFPRFFLNFVFSPILISTGILLSILLRLGAIQRDERENYLADIEDDKDHKWVTWETENETEIELGIDRKRVFFDSFVEWNAKAPLEVIYEEYEGEEEDGDGDSNGKVGIEGKVSLAIYYPESDSGSSSEFDFTAIEGWDSLENMCFRWDEEDKEGLIEIALDDKKRISVFPIEEENMIEIDIS